jgi:isopenicillin-N epimerase
MGVEVVQHEAGNPLWGDDWPSVQAQWDLDPAVTFLNHGSFGATPRPVLEHQAALRREMEAQPVEFLWRRLKGAQQAARSRVAAFLNADPDGLAFVPNATTGVATVLAGLDPSPGDEVVLTDHAYPGVSKAVRRLCDRSGADMVIAAIPLPIPQPDEIVARFVERLTERTKLAIVDHVTSPTAAIFPVERIVTECRLAGVPVLVDAAHGSGMLDVDLTRLQPDFWTGNFHKWVCAPKGAAALFVAPEHRERIRPLVPSHGYGGSFRDEFDWTGTHDPTPYLSVPAALDFLGGLGWRRIRRHNHELAAYGSRIVSEAVGTTSPVPAESFGSMAVVALPPWVATTQEDADAAQAVLYEQHRIEVPFTVWNGRGLVRLSAQAYNAPSHYERLAEALPRVLSDRAGRESRR